MLPEKELYKRYQDFMNTHWEKVENGEEVERDYDNYTFSDFLADYGDYLYHRSRDGGE